MGEYCVTLNSSPKGVHQRVENNSPARVMSTESLNRGSIASRELWIFPGRCTAAEAVSFSAGASTSILHWRSLVRILQLCVYLWGFARAYYMRPSPSGQFTCHVTAEPLDKRRDLRDMTADSDCAGNSARRRKSPQSIATGGVGRSSYDPRTTEPMK